ncbi:E3 ubiquitin-protein ligase TRIM39-like isoform X2 [Amphiprion ocellaris]|uniref:E3 ubiquitin-protein ligase TRIM39-like n=1 Tax=Amphiprion ocellaris TaxID=80972 RepID=A0AAQ5XTE1_AMPOC|nr:E3 ubiquitin-protein ligase TRIM39-like isoform X2 [Amphiprion ocellaris]
MAAALSEEQFLCSICLESFKNPVSIPCGHNFCLECIKRYWDTKRKSDCPLCKETFRNRPQLRVNVGLRDITEQFKRSLKGKPGYKPVPPKRLSQRQSSRSDEVPCNICDEHTVTAVKSCFVCQASYCDVHLTPHQQDPVLMKHRLVDPAVFATSHHCRNHNKLLEMFCKTDQTPVCLKCTERDHKHHEIVPMEKESRRIKTQLKKTEAEFEQMIQARIRKTEEIKHALERSQINKERKIQTSVQVFTMVVSAIETNQALLIEDIEEKQEAIERLAEELLNKLKQEISELQRRRSELQSLEHSRDHLHLVLSSSCLRAPPPTRDWSEVRVQSDVYIGTVRRAFSKLVEICNDLDKKLSTEEDVTLDPETAAGWLILSSDGKKVSLGSHQRKLSFHDDPRRFDSCVSVLGKQSFTSGRHYWVVQVGDKTDWDLGVARESINRKGAITVRPDNGYWAICRRKGGPLSACTGPSITLHLQEIPQKVGIFLDYEEGSVSFYDAEAKTHIYTYSGCSFTEPMYPYFNPCLHDNGRNTAPLVICPVEHPAEDVATL